MAIRNNKRTFNNWDSVPILFGSDVCAMVLGIPVNTIQKMAKNGIIPAHKIGKNYRYEKDEIRKWILSQ